MPWVHSSSASNAPGTGLSNRLGSQVRRVSDVVVLPTTFGKKRLVAVRGVVTNRIPYKEETLLGFDHLNFRVDLSDDNGFVCSCFYVVRCRRKCL